MLWFLLVWSLFSRLPRLLSETIIFGFDQGRDALTILRLITSGNPVFVGPSTSIPGLFFGPGWYYLQAPVSLLLQGNPLAGSWTMLVLSLAMIILASKYLGVIEAVIFSAAPLWLELATGSGNALPMGLIGLLLVITLKNRWPALWLGIILGLGFHFSSALSILWLLIVPWLIKPKQWPRLALGILITFIPQLLFELKHGFSQTRAVIDYFSAGESQQINPGKISLVTRAVIHELNLAILPDSPWLTWPGVLIISAGIRFWPALAPLILVPLVGFWFLHFNPWYVYGLAPLAVAAAGKILRLLPKPLTYSLLLLLILSALKPSPRPVNHKGFLSAKIQALDYVYQQAGGRPFASYHYHPEIYDYAYQYLYLWQAFKGQPLPVEFSYQPSAPVYIHEKADLLSKLPQANGKPEVIFLIIEKPDNLWHYPFESWLKNINYRQIVSRKTIGPELEVWQAVPETPTN